MATTLYPPLWHDNRLHPTQRKEFEQAFPVSCVVSYLKTDEICRRLDFLHETPTAMTLLFDSNVVVELAVDKGISTAVALLEGEAARAAIDRVGYKVCPKDRALAAQVLVLGADPSVVSRALSGSRAAPWAKLGLRPEEEGRVARYGIASAILEIHFSASGRIADHRWIEGLSAYRAYRAAAVAKRWDSPDLPGGVREAKGEAQAALFVAIQPAELQQSYAVAGGWCALGALSPGVSRVFRFRYADSPTAEALLDPAQLDAYARAQINALSNAKNAPLGRGQYSPEITSLSPLRRRRAEAIAAIEAALAMIPAGASAIPASRITSPVGMRLLKDRPDYFSREQLLSLLRQLQRL